MSRHHHAQKSLRRIHVWVLTGALVTGAALLMQPEQASAHCDSVSGPVVNAARQALDTNDVKLILPYVKAGSEAELTATFKHALEVRKLGGEAKNLADTYFFETAVRLHRIGEGAGFTGLKDHVEYTPGLTAAEKAVETGSVDDVLAVLHETMKHGIEAKWHAVLEAREHAAKLGTVEANREKVEAELIFELYVVGVEEAMQGNTAHSEDAPVGEGHTH